MPRKKKDELKVEYVPVAQLVPYANNAKIHTDEQVGHIVKSIEEFGFDDPIGVWTNADGEMEIVEGHGRVLALQKMGVEKAPIIRLDHLTDEQRRAYSHVHNQTTIESGFDEDILRAEFDSLPNVDWGAFGFNRGGGDSEDNPYTQKVDVPQYTIEGDGSTVADCFDDAKYRQLLEHIDAAEGLDEEQKDFLRLAATRHIVFNYKNIAEVYAAADEEMQQLMEESALIIIDFDDAIKYGFVDLQDGLGV